MTRLDTIINKILEKVQVQMQQGVCTLYVNYQQSKSQYCLAIAVPIFCPLSLLKIYHFLNVKSTAFLFTSTRHKTVCYLNRAPIVRTFFMIVAIYL